MPKRAAPPETDNKVVESGDTVHVHYRGMLEDDSVFDTSDGREPLAFEAGAGDVIKGFDEAVLGMRVGQTKRVVIPPEEGYGAWRPDQLMQVDKQAAGESAGVVVPGMVVQVHTPEDDFMEGIVTDVAEDFFTLDLNHPLAGKVLTFEITLVSVEGPKVG